MKTSFTQPCAAWWTRFSGCCLPAFLFFFLSFISVGSLRSQTVQTEFQDYPPGSTVNITGSGFQPNEIVNLKVLHADGDPLGTDAEYHSAWTATADASGNISTTWWVPEDGDALGATFILTADGTNSGLHAETIFTDTLDWCLGVTQSSFCSGATSTLTFTATVATSSTPGQVGTIRVTIPAAYVVNSASFVSASGKTWLSPTITGNVVCIRASTNPDRIVNPNTLIFTVTVTNPIVGVSTNYTIPANGNNNSNTNTCTATSGTVAPLAGCSSLGLTVNSPVVATATITQALCHGGAASVVVTATGGSGSYTGTGTFPLADGASATYIVKDANLCSATSNSVTASSPSQLVATAVITQALCHGDPASVTVTATGGTGSYTGTGTFPLADGASATYIVKDANLCSATSNSVTASSPSQLVATAVITQALCHGDPASVTVTATGGTGSYTGTGTFPLADGASATYIVKDANLCSATSNSVTASSPSQLVATAVITQALCHGDPASVTVTATGGIGSYTGTGTFPLADGASATYIVKDANLCSATSNSVTASSPSQLVATAVITQALCHGDPASVTVTATGGTGSYTGTGTFPLADGASATYIVKDANLCSATSNSVTASSPSQLVATAVITQALCHGDPASVTVTATGGTGSYTGTGTFPLADGASATYIVKDASLCSATSNSVTASSPSQLVATAVITQALCHGDPASVTVTATGGTGSYTGTGTFPLADGASATYIVKDANLCSATSNSVTASSPTLLTALKVEGSIACYGGTTTVTITAAGGTPPYSNDGAHTVSAGPYSFTVTDANNCSTVVSGTINQPTLLQLTVTNSNPILYFGYSGDQTTIIKGVASGGIPVSTPGNYTYTTTMDRAQICDWINSAGDEVITGGTCFNILNYSITAAASTVNATLLQDATFTVTVKDKNNCTATGTTVVYAEDVRCFAGNSNIAKVTLCHKTGSAKTPCVTICVDADAVEEHLAHGDAYGACPKNAPCPPPSGVTSVSTAISTIAPVALEVPVSALDVHVMNNPSVSNVPFRLKVVSNNEVDAIQMRVMDGTGKPIEYKSKLRSGQTVEIGRTYVQGMYFVEVLQGNQRKMVKLVKQ